MGVIKALKALAAIPEQRRSPSVRRFLRSGVELVLTHRVYRRSHDRARVSKPGWLRLGFPLMYQTDILEILSILTSLGCTDDRMRDAIDVLASKRDARGRWKLDRSFNGKFQVNIEENGRPSKWITLRALTVLKQCGGITRPSGS